MDRIYSEMLVNISLIMQIICIYQQQGSQDVALHSGFDLKYELYVWFIQVSQRVFAILQLAGY